jgi:hypothetical protein
MSSERRASVSIFEDFQIVITAFTITRSGRQQTLGDVFTVLG